MSEWLLLFLRPLGAAACADLFQHEDEDKDNSAPRPEPEPQTDGTAGDDTLSAPYGYHGRVKGRDRDDLITVGSPENASHSHDGTTLTPDDGHWNSWPGWDPNSPGALPPDEAGDDSGGFGNVSVAKADGDTIIRLGSDEVMRIKNATALNIVFQTDRYREEWSDGSIQEGEFRKGDGEVLNDHTVFTDLDVNEVDRSSLDVVINSYLTLYT